MVNVLSLFIHANFFPPQVYICPFLKIKGQIIKYYNKYHTVDLKVRLRFSLHPRKSPEYDSCFWHHWHMQRVDNWKHARPPHPPYWTVLPRGVMHARSQSCKSWRRHCPPVSIDMKNKQKVTCYESLLRCCAWASQPHNAGVSGARFAVQAGAVQGSAEDNTRKTERKIEKIILFSAAHAP